MRLFYLFFILLLFFFSQTIVSAFAISTPTPCVITATLRVGSKGAEVQCLQKRLNLFERFSLSVDGKFGLLTKAAVVNFQLNNRLKPDGIVGPLTRAVFNIVTTNDTSPAINDNSNEPESSGASLSNLDKFIKDVVAVNRENGKSEKELELMANALRKRVTESDQDFNQEFKEMLIREAKETTVFRQVFSKTLSFLGITPSTAFASGIPFGGALLFAFRCDYNWMIDISPLPPTGVVVLTYFDGTQGFASYNIPFTSWLLGFYTPPGVCVIGEEIVIGTEGTILPMVGSSPL